MKTDQKTTFAQLPDKIVRLILHLFLELPSDGVLAPNEIVQSRLVTLARVNQRIRKLTASLIKKLHYIDKEGAWPAVKVLGPHVWDQLEELEIKVNRSNALGFLKWVIPSTRITRLNLIMTGEPYPEPKLALFERAFIGRLFTQIGSQLKSLRIHGVGNKSILFATMFQCTVLEEIEIGDYGDDGGSTLTNAAMLLCAVNREHLRYLKLPLEAWKSRMDMIPEGNSFASGCEILWKTLMGSYKAGMKESAVNLKSDEEELVEKFKTLSVRMDKLEEQMNVTLEALKEVANNVEQKDVPLKVFEKFFPSVNEDGSPLIQY